MASTRCCASPSTSAPAESTQYTHCAPASTMIRACFASSAGEVLCAIMRNPTVSMPRLRASPKCWMDTSASVQWVAIRATEAPASWAALQVVHGADAGHQQHRDRGLGRLLHAAAEISLISSTRLKP